MMQKMVDLVERTKLLASSSTLFPSALGGNGNGGGTVALSTTSHNILHHHHPHHHHHQLAPPAQALSSLDALLPSSSSSVESSSSSDSSTSTSPLTPTAVEEEMMIRSATQAAASSGCGGGGIISRSGSPFPFPAIMSVSPDPKTPAQFLLGLGVQILEGRLPDHKQAKGFLEGEHCQSLFKPSSHFCDYETNALCRQLAHLQFMMVPDSTTLSLEVFLTPKHHRHLHSPSNASNNPINEYNNASSALLANGNNQVQKNEMLIEKWKVSIFPQEETEAGCGEAPTTTKGAPPIMMTPRNLHNAVRSFLHFSQLAAWLSKKKEFTSVWKVRIEMGDKGDSISGAANSSSLPHGTMKPDGWDRHEFPSVTMESQSFWDSQYQSHRHMSHHSANRGGWGKGRCNTKWIVKVAVDSLPRMENFPLLPVPSHQQTQTLPAHNSTSITISNNSKPCLSSTPSTSSTTTTHNASSTNSTKSQQILYEGGGGGDLNGSNGMMLLGENEESAQGVRIRFRGGRSRRNHSSGGTNGSSSHRSRPKNLRIAIPDVSHSNEEEDVEPGLSNSTFNGTCTNLGMEMEFLIGKQMMVLEGTQDGRHHHEYSHHQSSQTHHPNISKIPTLREKLQFDPSLNNRATTLVFHKNGLPLTSSPTPVRRSGGPNFNNGVIVAARGGKININAGRFDFETSMLPKYGRARAIGCPHVQGQRLSEPSQSLLGSFEESILNGRIEPVSTVEGFTAEVDVGSSHNFKLPVTCFFYTFCDNDRVSSPYSAHVTLAPTVYPIPRKGTLKLTLLNPMRTVVKMFVINFDLSRMPANSETFIRQKILFMPLGKTDRDPDARKWLRYLIHLRFGSSPLGDKVFLHKDIRMIVLQKLDDTVIGLPVSGENAKGCHEESSSVSYELRSFTYFADVPPTS